MLFSHQKPTYFKSQNGFTLVELAIVMVIIGVLIGGVLKGQEMITNARVKGVMADLKSIEAALQSFSDRYSFLPGDMANASARIPGCAANAICSSNAGNGNNILGTITTNWSRDNQSGIGTEATQFWSHLALSGFISGVSLQGNTQWGDAYPGSPLGGGYQVAQINETGTNDARGIYIILRLPPTGDPHPASPGDAVLTTSQLRTIDQTMDNGMAWSGYVVADDAGGRCWITGTGEYNPAFLTQGVCLMAYKIQ